MLLFAYEYGLDFHWLPIVTIVYASLLRSEIAKDTAKQTKLNKKDCHAAENNLIVSRTASELLISIYLTWFKMIV